MSEPFSRSKSYANEWEFMDGITGGTLIPRDADGLDLDRPQVVKCRELDITKSAFAATTGTLGFNASMAVFQLWQLNRHDLKPSQGYSLLALKRTWSIHSVIKKPYGPEFQCLCSAVGETEATNAL